jgi:hypothetical protein
MEKNIILEIKRINNLMGLKEDVTPKLWAWLDDAVVGTFDNFTSTLAKFRNKGVPITDKEIGEFVSALKKSGNISDTEAKELLTLLTNNQGIRKVLSTTDDFLTDMKNIYQFSEPPSLAIMQKLSKLTSTQMDIIMDEVLKSIRTGIMTLGTNLNDSYNVFVTNFVNSLQNIIDNKEIINSVDDIYNSIDDKIISWLNKNIGNNKLTLKQSEQYYEAYSKELRSDPTIAAKIEELRVAGLLESNPPKIQKPSKVSGYTPKDNPGSDLLKSAKSTNGDGTVKVKPDETAEPIDNTQYQDDYIQGLIDGVEESGFEVMFDDINPNEVVNESVDDILNKSKFDIYRKNGIDQEFLKAFQVLIIKAQDSASENLKKIVSSIRQGKKFKFETPEQEKLIMKELKDSVGEKNYNLIVKRLDNPKGIKMGPLSEIFWVYIEPIVKKYRELLTNTYFANKAKKYGYIDVNDINMYFDNFTKNIEGTIINYRGGDISLGEIKKLKDQFRRLKSAADMDNLYYASLWTDLNGYLSKTLDKNSFESWGKITKKLMSEKGSAWRWVSWKEIISDAKITEEAQESLLKYSKGGNKTVLESIFTTSLLQKSEDIYKIGVKKIWKQRIGLKLLSAFTTGSFKTPKEMEEFLLKNGYATKNVNVGIKGVGIKLNAGGAYYLNRLLWRYIALPIIFTLVEWGIIGGMERMYGELDNKDGVDVGIDILIKRLIRKPIISDFVSSEEFKEAAPDWYEALNPFLDLIVSSPLSNFTKHWVESQFILDQKTPEEKDLEEFDEKIEEINKDLQKNPPTGAKESEMKNWKDTINGIMIQEGLVTPQIAKLVTDKMSIKRGIDPNRVNELREGIKTIYSDEGVIDKVAKVRENMKTVDEKVKGSAVEHIVVTTPNYVFKLINVDYKGIMYIKPDYETLMKTPNDKQTTHPLNELKF